MKPKTMFTTGSVCLILTCIFGILGKLPLDREACALGVALGLMLKGVGDKIFDEK